MLSPTVVREQRLSAVPREFAGARGFPRFERAAAGARGSHTTAAVLFKLLVAGVELFSVRVRSGDTRARASG